MKITFPLLAKTLIGCSLIGAFQINSAQAQTIVSTTPTNKNFLIEKGTGHVCGSCPSIALKCDTVINSHPGRGILIEYHFGPDAVPQAAPFDKDFTTPYGDTIYDPAKLHWPFYLNMMVNRRDQGSPYGSTFIFGTTNQVQAEADAVVTQPAPVNLAMSSTFNSTTRLLTVYVEAYYTAASATSMNYLQIALTEDSIIATQYDPAYTAVSTHFNPTFNHMNTFRANLNGFAGDTVSHTSAGTFIARTYTYTIPAYYKNIACNPLHCKLTAYMAEEKAASGIQSFTGKIQNAVRTKVGVSTVAVAQVDKTMPSVYPNPTTGIIQISGVSAGSYSVTVTDAMGKNIYTAKDCNSRELNINLSQYPIGLYVVNVTTSNGTSAHKVTLSE